MTQHQQTSDDRQLNCCSYSLQLIRCTSSESLDLLVLVDLFTFFRYLLLHFNLHQLQSFMQLTVDTHTQGNPACNHYSKQTPVLSMSKPTILLSTK